MYTTPQNKELQSKLHQLRRSTELDLEESLRDHTLRFDREKQQLKLDNQDLQTQLDKVNKCNQQKSSRYYTADVYQSDFLADKIL